MGLSTHVLDTMHGTPAAGMAVRLLSVQGAQRTLVKELVLNSDGRNPDGLLYEHAALQAGRYRLGVGGGGPPWPSAGIHGQPELNDQLVDPVPPRPRRIWAVLIVCLSLALGAQITWWNKSQWLAHWPVAHEWAQSVCAQWRCQLDWPQNLGLVMIERAHFEPDGEGHHRLQIQLTNRANHPVATPWLDLMLTDGEDRIVIRRALAPEEMGLPKHLTPGVDAVSSVHWRVDSDVEERLSGYRAEIFYP